MADSGNIAVNADETVLSGKIWFKGNESVLILNPETLVCRGFASSNGSFALKLDKITGCYADQKNPSEFHVTAFVPRSLEDNALIQVTFDFRCPSPEEVIEWVEILQSALTDRSIRAVEETQRISNALNQSIEATVVELLAIFRAIDPDIIRTIALTNRGDLQKSVDELLAISDPSYNPPPQIQQRSTSTPSDQLQLDEQLALALQDELFLQEVKNNEDWRRTIAPEQATGELSISDKLLEMSEATKKTFSDLYSKFKRATTTKSQPIELGEEMTSIKSDPSNLKPEPSYEDEEDEDAPLERNTPNTTLFSRKDGYQPVPLQEKKENLRSDINDDDL